MSLLNDRLTPLLRHFTETGPAGCALQVAQRGRTLYEGYAGLACLEEQRPIGPDTIYRIYSMSKIVTCTAALMLYERGLFALNDPLDEYMPEFHDPQVCRMDRLGSLSVDKAAGPIRIRHLFTMTSGYPYPGEGTETGRMMAKIAGEAEAKDPVRKWTLDDLMRLLSTLPLAFDPGTHWLYGMSHDILGALIERLTGKRLGEFMRDEIFGPLDMADTSFRISPEKRQRLCSLYNRAEDGTLSRNTAMDGDFEPDAVFESGGGGLLSTLHDYGRFAQALASGELDGVRLLSPNTLRLMMMNQLEAGPLADYCGGHMAGYGYGLGVYVLTDPAACGGNANAGEFGWSGMAGTLVFMDPKEQLSAVYMQQMMPTRETYHLPRLRNGIYGAL